MHALAHQEWLFKTCKQNLQELPIGVSILNRLLKPDVHTYWLAIFIVHSCCLQTDARGVW